MARFGFLGKQLPALGVAMILLLPAMGTALGMAHPGSSIAGLGGTATDPIPIGGPGSQPEQPSGPVTPDQTVGAGEPAVVIDSDGEGIQPKNAPNETQVTIRDDGAGFWFSTQINESRAGSTIQLWVDINNTASDTQKLQLAVDPESPLEVGDNLSGSPVSTNEIMTEQRESLSNVWTVRCTPAVSGVESVSEPIVDPNAIKYRTNQVVADRNRDGNITVADIEFGNDTDMTDTVDGIEDLRRNDDGTVTLYLNGSTDADGTYDTVSYDTGGYLVIPIHIPEGTPAGTYTVEGQFKPFG